MKRIIVLASLFFLLRLVNAQELPFAWNNSIQPLRTISTTSTSFSYNVLDGNLDPNGNRLITGWYNGTLDFDPSSNTTSLVSTTNTQDIFVAKYDPQGNLKFAISIGNAQTIETGTSIHHQPIGDQIIVTGRFSGTVDFDPGAGTFNMVSSGQDAFILVLDKNGLFVNAVKIGGASTDDINKVLVSSTGDIFVWGNFVGTVDVDPGAGTTNLTSQPSTAFNTFLARYNNTLTSTYWAYSLGAQISARLLLTANNLYLTSNTNSVADYNFAAEVATITNKNGSGDGIVAKYDLNGGLVWLKTFGGDFLESAPSIAVDASDKIYLTGYFYGTVDLDPGSGISNFTSQGEADSYLMMWDAGGNLLWTKVFGGGNDDLASTVGLVSGNNIIIGGIFENTIDLDPGAGVTSRASNGLFDDFISYFNSGGTFVSGFSFGGQGSETTPVIATDGATRIEVVSNYTNTTDFDPTSDVNSLTVGNPNFPEIHISTYFVLSALPTAQPTGLVFGTITSSSIDLSFTDATPLPSGYIILRKSGAAPVSQPKDGRSYNTGDILGDAVVVQSNASNASTVLGLAANSNYFFAVYAYNGSGTTTNYYLTGALIGNSATQSITYNRTTDSLALVSIYNFMGGVSWTNKTNWLTANPINTWYGISFVGNRVTAVNLPTNNVTGQIPSDIGNLTALQQIDFHGNSVGGQIPSEIGNIVGLQNLALYNNQLSGSLPSSIGSLSGLQYFDAAYNKLTGTIPSTFSSLTSLFFLSLSSNKLNGTIDPIKNLTGLTHLLFFSNQFSGSIPPELGTITGLVQLNLSDNKFSGTIPNALTGLTSLQLLHLGTNSLSGVIPTTIGNLTALTDLDLGANQLSGAVPAGFSSLTNLSSIKLGYNGALSGALPVNSTFTSLTYLDISGNQFDVLSDLSSLTSLTTLLVANNKFTFEDLEPNISKLGTSTNYAPQANIGTTQTFVLLSGQPINLSISLGGTANTYQWKRGATNVGTNSNSFSVASATSTDAGTYTLTVTNSIVPGLTLSSFNQVVSVNTKSEGLFDWVSAGDLTSEGLPAPGTSTTDQNYSGQWGDFNNDGFEDIFLSGIATQERSYLYKNNGDGTFSKAPNGAYFYMTGRSVSWADYNNDGFLDCFAPGGTFAPDSVGYSSIFRNNGNSTFSRILLPGNPTSIGGTWADTDNDGDLDLIVNIGSTAVSLYRNDAGSFTLVGGINVNVGAQWNTISIDLNNDGKMDVYIPDDTNRNMLFGNGNNTFSLVTGNPIVTDALTSPRGASFADIDNDGDMDAYLTSGSGSNMFYINNGNGSFAAQLPTAILGQAVFGNRGSTFADYDNDGFVDLLTTQNTGSVVEWILYKNNGNGTFTRQSTQSFKGGGQLVGASFGDYNNDGFLDIVSTSFGLDYNGLYRNKGNANRWLQVKLTGKYSNRSAIGAMIDVYAGGQRRHQRIITNNGFGNQNSLIAQFGLGASTVADSIKITWPSGFVNKLVGVTSNQRLNLTEINSDSVALVTLFNAMGGSSWTTKAGWLTGPLSTWYGVTVRNKRVVKLQMYSNNISGALPSAIGDLTALDSLILAGNKINGTIPSAIGNLKKVVFIDLGGNQLTGNFPASLFTLTQLKTFGFAGNQLSGTISTAVGNLVNLESFWIDNNKFSGALPTEVNSMVNLKNFYIQNNEFTSVPALTGFTLLGGSIQNNFLNFNSLPLITSVVNLQFNPQKPIPVGSSSSVILGGSFSFSYDAGGTGTTYQWTKNYVDIPGQTSTTLSVSSATAASAGIYWLKAQNPAVPGFTLETSQFIVEVTSPLSAEDSGYKFLKKIGAEALGLFQYALKEIVVGNFIYAHDYNANKIHKFDLQGNLLLSFNLTNNAFSGNGDMSIDANDAIYISSEISSNLVKYDASGNFVYEIINTDGTYGNAIDPSGNILFLPRNTRPYVIRKHDRTTGQFLSNIALSGGPSASIYLDIETDGSGNIYAIDPSGVTYGFPRIDKFTSAGVFISSIDLKAAGMDSWHGWHFSVDQVSGEIFLQTQGWGGAKTYHFGSAGNLIGTFTTIGSAPYDLAITPQGILVSDMEDGLFLYDSNGNFIKNVGPQKNANGQFNFAVQIAVDSKGFRYVADRKNNRIQKFNSSGNWVSSFGSFGSAVGQLSNPISVALDRYNNIYVADFGNNRIQKFSSTGTPLLAFGSSGTANGQFSQPNTVAISKTGEVIVGDRGNSRVQIFKPDGTFVSSFGTNGTNDGQFNFIQTLTIENDGNILVADNQARLQRFTLQGQFISSLNMSGAVNYISSIATDMDGYIYMPDNSIAKKFDRNGGLIRKIGTAPTAAYADGELRSLAVHANIAGDTLWISDYNPTQRISIFTANFRNASATDSLALVDLYNSTKGTNWTTKTNWLTGTVNTWHGIKMSAGKIRGLNLQNNLLDGSLPASITTLDNLLTLNLAQNKLSGVIPDWNNNSSLIDIDLSQNLFSGATVNLPAQVQLMDLSDNQLTDVPSIPGFAMAVDLSNNKLTQLGNLPSSHPSLDTLMVQRNKLTFEDLEPNMNIKAFSYSPQDSVDVAESVLKQLGEVQTFAVSVGGTSNVYQWKKNEAIIAGAASTSLTISNITFGNDATYRADVTNSAVPGLTLASRKKILRVSSLTRDSIALRALYNLTNGAGWTTKTNWLTTSLRTGNWFGVTIANNRVSSLSLPNNNLVGRTPLSLADLQSVTSLNLSNNKITFVPDLETLSNATAINLSGNRLDFESIIPNSKISAVNYSNQAEIGSATTDLIDFGKDFTVKVKTGGIGNKYQWKRNGGIVTNATDTSYVISKIGRPNMGDYVVEVSNPGVPGFVLKSANKRVLAIASVSGKVWATTTVPASKGKIYLLRVVKGSGYDTLGTNELVAEGTYKFEKVVLDDYQIASVVDTVLYKKSLPTYYKNTILWEEAQVVPVNENVTGLDVNVVYKPSSVPVGNGVISGTITEKIGSGRTAVDKRVPNAGCMVRRVERTGRTEGETLTLVGYVFSNADGEFVLPKLEKGEYRLNIQYPGYPMDETSYVTIPIGDGLQSQVKVAANVQDGKIKVQKLIVTGIWEKEEYKAEVFPNPSTEYVQIQFGAVSKYRIIRLFDSTGKSVDQVNANDKEVKADVKLLPSGVYLLQVVDHDQIVKTVRILKE